MPTQSFPPGIVVLSASKDDQILSERLAFINQHRQLKVAVEHAKTNYTVREKVSLKLKVTDPEGRPVRTYLGMSLVDEAFNSPFDQGGYAAFILLGGLVVNAAIFIVNDLNNRSDKDYNKAVIKSVLGKTQPILLTVLSTCFGLIPFLIEGESEIFWFALAIGTIGGLLFSLFAVFFCLPVFLCKAG